MPMFVYSAKDSRRKLVGGTLEAGSEVEAVEKLGQMGYFPISLRQEGVSVSASAGSGSAGSSGSAASAAAAASAVVVPAAAPAGRHTKVRRRDLTIFLRQLADLLDAGVTLLNALYVIGEQIEQPALRSVVAGIALQVREGKGFSDTLAEYPKVFSVLVVSMVRSGEVGGMLPAVLTRLADFSEAEEELTAKVRSAMAYPALILVVGISTVAVLLTLVVPKLVSLFEEVGQALPLPTRILIGMSQWLVTWWWLVLGLIVLGAGLLRRFARSPEGKFTLDRLKLHVPVWGTLIQKVETARFSQSLGVLLHHGVAILQAVDVVAHTTGNEVLKRALLQIGERLQGGISLSQGMRESQAFPLFVIQMVSVGEESGTVDRSLLKVAEAYEREADRTMKLMTSLIEPIMILTMGLIVGFIVVAMLLPIFQIDIQAR